ncbi:LPS translocon maturation chaperone LptM [Candidatus Pantoea carbekii]|uniref:LPS translocon maturation chaperone LptM n=1 Tax=Candidatus Pantoea carbekii TaxID=1235990 RepID=UPI003898F414
MIRSIVQLSVILTMFSILGCGLKGPLYLSSQCKVQKKHTQYALEKQKIFKKHQIF